MSHSIRTRRVRQRPRLQRIARHVVQRRLWPEEGAPVFRQRQVRVRIEQRGNVTPYGGLALAHDLAMRLGIDRAIGRELRLLKLHLPYCDSDHILTHVYNQYVGGRCIEDIANLQHSDAIKHLLGACRIPDPSTAGDYLRRFGWSDLDDLQRVIDDAREQVWRRLPRRRRAVATIDMDSTVREVYGACKQGADFSYNGKWSYHPLLFTLAETREPLRTINRPGNSSSSDGAAEALEEILPRVARHFGTLFVRGDSKFYEHDIIAACARHGARFALCMDGYRGLKERADLLPESAWKPFVEQRAERSAAAAADRRTRRKRCRWRRRIARQREYRTLTTTDRWIAEFDYTAARNTRKPNAGVAGCTYRVVVQRQRVEESQGQKLLQTEYRYRFIISDIPRSHMDAAEVLCFAYGRCDQENIIEQFKNGIAAMRMPTGELLANGAFLLAGQLAWCLRAWLSLLALPRETTRWEWKWFRQAFVHVAARITHSARRAVVYLAQSHRFAQHLAIAAQRLQSFVFR